MQQRVHTLWGNFTWLSLTPLLASINDLIAKGLSDVVDERRARWVAGQRAAGQARDDFVFEPRIDEERDEGEPGSFSFLLVGDPGEMDASQYAVVKPLLAAGDGTDFMLIGSDVIYPAGDVNTYVDGFYLPYRDYHGPIYALPGNHDWYDGLSGFMFHFCGVEAPPEPGYRGSSYTPVERWARRLWRQPPRPDRRLLLRYRLGRTGIDKPWAPLQPGPYFAIGTEKLLVVCIDTGIRGGLDREQGEWLLRVSKDDRRPKVLVTGKPLVVNNKYMPGSIEWRTEREWKADDDEPDRSAEGERRGLTVDEIVRHPDHGYVAAIGGDIHNYQRYSIHAPTCKRPKRVIEYIVSGGGGAYLDSTHTIPAIDLHSGQEPPAKMKPVDEDRFRCYPLRGDSLALALRELRPVLRAVVLAIVLTIAAVITTTVLGVIGPDHRVRMLEDGPPEHVRLWEAVAAAGGAIGVILCVAGIGWLTSRFLPRGYRAYGFLAATLAFVAIGLFGLDQVIGSEWIWIWRVVAATLAGVAVPLTVIVVDQLSGGTGANATRALPLALLAYAAAFLTVRPQLDGFDQHVLFVGCSALVVGALVLLLSWVRRPPTDPRYAKTRVAARSLVGTLVVFGAPSVVLVDRFEEGWFPIALSIGLATVLVLLSVLLIGILLLFPPIGLLGVPAVLFSRGVDARTADAAARFVAKRHHDRQPTRKSARDVKLRWRDKWRFGLVYSNPLLKATAKFLEATEPPFFKSFLRLEVSGQTLRIECYGVSGYGADQHEPPIEDGVAIDLRTAFEDRSDAGAVTDERPSARATATGRDGPPASSGDARSGGVRAFLRMLVAKS